MRRKWHLIAPAAILGIAVFTAIGGGLVMLLWNWLCPQLFGLRPVTFWQAWGLLALCRILFGGLGVGRSARSSMRARMKERMENMTPEERERCRQWFQERVGFRSPGSEKTAGG